MSEQSQFDLHIHLGHRHEKLYPDFYRFDVLNLAEVEIKHLAEVTEEAACASVLPKSLLGFVLTGVSFVAANPAMCKG
jgi:hypothetical protein